MTFNKNKYIYITSITTIHMSQTDEMCSLFHDKQCIKRGTKMVEVLFMLSGFSS